MSVIVEMSIPSSQFVLGRALKETPDLEVELEQMIPVGGATIPYFWASDGDLDAFETVLEREPELTAHEAVDTVDDRTLYRVEWDTASDTFVQELVSHDVVLQRATGDDEFWVFQLRFPDAHALSEFHTACRNRGRDVTVERLFNPIEPAAADAGDLTDAQRNLILRAYDAGYFDVPRRITLEELAGELGLSDQSVNERLRRGLSSLIATTMTAGATRDA